MDEAAKFELEKRIDLYKLYMDVLTKGIGLFLVIATFLLKTAFDDPKHSSLLCIGGAISSLAVLIPIRFAFLHGKDFSLDFDRLASATGTKALSSKPLMVLLVTTLIFWAIIFLGWIVAFLTQLK
jgi:hypothetical protein